MAILGGGIGGAGNPVGGSFTGPAEALEIIGDHAYAYSSAAALTSATGEETRLEFTTGNYYFVGEFNALNGDTSSDLWQVSVFMNGTLIMNDKIWNAAASHNDTFHVIPIIIPPYTQMKVTMQVSADSDSVSSQFIGRIYRTRD